MPPVRLPIDDALPELLRTLRTSTAVVLRAPPGAGKTTRVPPALLAHGVAGGGQILLVEPRRVAARAAAGRMAAEHGSTVGDVFGYHVRFDRRAGPRTRVVAVTPGILLRYLHADPFLEAASVVVFDEFHERGLDADLALGLVRLLRQTVRPELRVVVMSATVDAGPVGDYLGGCPAVTSEGRTFPVDVAYRPAVRAADAVADVLAATPGDVLVFLPGMREIRQLQGELDPLTRRFDLAVLPLHGDLPPDRQDAALRKLDRRKVVLATNVAETSVTVDGVTAVVDTGTARQLEFDPAVGLDRLRLVPISRASADQRAGRAGRTGPGVCVRLWDEVGHRSRPAFAEPEVRRVDLAGAALALLAAGEPDVERFPWLDPPRPETVRRAVGVLRHLGAVDDTGLTPLGRDLAALPVHPRVGRLLVEGRKLGAPHRAALAAALLSDRDPFDRADGPPRPPPPTSSDVLARVEAVERFEHTRRADSPLGRLHPEGTAAVLRSRDQLLKLLEPYHTAPAGDADAAVLRAVLAAYPDRLARRRDPGDRRAVMVGGRGVKLAPQSGVAEAELFVCVDVDAGDTEAIVRAASAVRRDWLPADKVASRTEVEFDPDAEKLVARKRTRFADLVLDDVPAHIADEGQAARALAAAAVDRLDRVLPPADEPAGQLLARIRCLRGWVPELGLPAFDPPHLAELLPGLCHGKRSLDGVRHADWPSAIRGALTFDQWQAVDREAPADVPVPSGRRVPLAYEVGRPPVLAARIQELFGLADTPRVGRGRVKVVVHLLAPNYRPQQVTDDLASFWRTGYAVVRKELRGRYPKHHWPEAPTAADAAQRPGRPRTD